MRSEFVKRVTFFSSDVNFLTYYADRFVLPALMYLTVLVINYIA